MLPGKAMESGSPAQMENGVVLSCKDNPRVSEYSVENALDGQWMDSMDEHKADEQLFFKHDWHNKSREEISKVEADILIEVTHLALEEGEDFSDSNVNTESEQEDDANDDDYNPSKIQGSHSHTGMSKLSKKANAKTMPEQAAKDRGVQKSQPKNHISYESCPPAHWLPILCLLLKHFCLHPLLPEWHGKA